MTILRPLGAKIREKMGFVAARGLPGACQGLARGCQGLPGAAWSCQELPGTPSAGKNPRTIGSCESKVACIFFIVFRVFECLIDDLLSI